MSFNRGRNSIFPEKRDKIYLIVLVLILVGTLINSSSTRTVYVLTDGKKSAEPDLEKFCGSFIDQIINKSLHKEMVENDIYDVLVQDNYKVLNLVGREKPLYSRSSEEECSVIVQDQLGLRRFDIRVNKSIDYPFYFRVQRVDEPRIEG